MWSGLLAVLGISLYSAPLGFNWDPANNSFWVLPPVTPDNVGLLSEAAILEMELLSARTATNNLLWPIGGDFAYQSAPETVL